jgi:hypothetical protein
VGFDIVVEVFGDATEDLIEKDGGTDMYGGVEWQKDPKPKFRKSRKVLLANIIHHSL